MPGILDRLVYEVGYDVDKSSFDNVQSGVKGIARSFASLATVVAGAVTAVAGFTALVVTQEAEHLRLASAMGVSADTMNAFGNEMKKIGGTTENFLDLVEETTNKIGEMKGLGEFTTLEESLGILHLRFKDIKDLSPEKQFEAITKAALALEDQQKAATAVDMLMSGEANKLISSLRAQGISYDDVIRKQKMLSFETDASRANTLKFADGLNDLSQVTSSLGQYVAGELGGIMTDITGQFVEWASANKEVIASGIKEFVQGFAAVASGLWTVLSTLGRIIGVVVNAFGGLDSVIRLIMAAGVLFGLLKIAQAVIFIGAAVAGTTFSVGMLSAAFATFRKMLLIGALILIFEDLIGWIQGADSVMGRLVGTFSTWKVQAVEGLKQIGAMLIESLLAPLNLVISAVDVLIAGLNKIPGVDIKRLKTISAGDVTGGVLGGQASIKDMSKQALGFNTPGSAVNSAIDKTKGAVAGAVSTVSNAITVNVNAASASAHDVARLVGDEINKQFQSASTSLQTTHK